MIPTRMPRWAMDHPWTIMALVLAWTMISIALFARVRLEPDLGNMLSAEEFARHFNEEARKQFNLHDALVLGVINDRDKNGVFNPDTLKKILALSRLAATLHDPKKPEQRVIARDILAPDTVDMIEQAGLGKVRFTWLMSKAPATRAQALAIRDRAMADPMLKGIMISEDGRAMAISIPISSTDFALRVGLALKAKIKAIGAGTERFYITGLPLAEDTFARDMLLQLFILAPLVLLLISLSLYGFFRKVRLVVPPLVIATATVISTMGLLIGSGNDLQLINAMIPIFVLPLALAASIRCLSRFLELYRQSGDRRQSVEQTLDSLHTPLAQAALVPAAGFASLVLVPVPPIRTFGLFVAIGILLAWLLTIVFMPASLMLLSEHDLKTLNKVPRTDPEAERSPINRYLFRAGRTALASPWPVLAGNMAVAVLAVIGLLLLRVDDNPIRWLGKNHPVRVGDRVLNRRLAGTWQAYLVLQGEETGTTPRQAADWLSRELKAKLDDVPVIRQKVLAEISEAAAESEDPGSMAKRLEQLWTSEIKRLPPDDAVGNDRWSTALDTLGRLRNQGAVFKRPEVLDYVAALQRHLEGLPVVGKSTSLVDLVRRAHQSLLEGDPRYFVIPDTVNAVNQALATYQESHEPEHVRHLVSRDYSRANILVRLRSGDSREMKRLIRDTDSYVTDNTPPVRLQHTWTGPTPILAVWQQRMTSSLLRSLALACVILAILASLIFRSPVWSALTMAPPACCLGAVTAIIGLSGADFTVPMALLFLLPMGLAVDSAIHFLQATRKTMQRLGDWQETMAAMLREPARTTSLTSLVITAGFTPLLFAPLIPFRAAGAVLITTVLCSALATIFTLPALVNILRTVVFKGISAKDTAEGREMP